MSKYEEVIDDIINRINSLNYDDKEKNIIKTNIMLKLFCTSKAEINKKKNAYVYKRESLHPRGVWD